MINQKKAKKLRMLLGVKTHGDRTYMTADGAHHTMPAQVISTARGSLRFGRMLRGGPRMPSIPAYGGAVTLSKDESRSGYQRIKRSRIANQILSARAA